MLHGIIFAYGESPDLRELSQPRNSCSLPYGGRYRLIDFTLSSLVNAGVTDMGIIVHSSYQSLLDHVGAGKDWDLARKNGGLRILPPFGYAGKRQGLYRGRMDALIGVYTYLEDIKQDYVILADGDLAANLPIADIFEEHLNSGADITVVCTDRAAADPQRSHYFTPDQHGWVTEIAFRPFSPSGYESLEVYILSKNLLMSMVDYAAAHNVASFGDVLIDMRGRVRIATCLYKGYAARIHSVNNYFQRSMELLDPAVRASLFQAKRPVRTKDQSNPATKIGPEAKIVNSLIADGCIVEGTVVNSILARGVHVAKGAVVENSILLQHTDVAEGGTLKYTITDKYVRICAGRTLMGHETYPMVIPKHEII